MMNRRIAIACACLTLTKAALNAQSMHYDAYYVLPGAAGVAGMDLVFSGSEPSDSADESTLDLTSKYSLTDKLEAGALIRSGLLDDTRETFSALTVGAKYAFATEVNAVTLNLALPVGDVEEYGVAAGYMHTHAMGGLSINSMLLVGWFDAYNEGSGIAIAALVEPTRQISQSVMGYCDLLIATQSDDMADELAIDLQPNIDLLKGEQMAINLGVRFGLVGNRRQDEVGLALGFLKLLE